MPNKQPQADLPGTPSAQVPGAPIRPGNATPATRSSTPNSRDVACLGPNLVVKGDISGSEDLQIDDTVEGSISLQSQRLTVGDRLALQAGERNYTPFRSSRSCSSRLGERLGSSKSLRERKSSCHLLPPGFS
jgi:hypothetical protein